MKLLDQWHQKIDRLDQAQAVKANILLSWCIFNVLMLSSAFSIRHYLDPLRPALVVNALVNVLALIAASIFIYKNPDKKMGRVIMLFAMLALLPAPLYFHGGLLAPASTLLVFLPILAAFLAGSRVSLMLFAGSFLTIFIFYFLGREGLLPNPDTAPGPKLQTIRATIQGILLVLTFGLGLTYERLKNFAYEELAFFQNSSQSGLAQINSRGQFVFKNEMFHKILPKSKKNSDLISLLIEHSHTSFVDKANQLQMTDLIQKKEWQLKSHAWIEVSLIPHQKRKGHHRVLVDDISEHKLNQNITNRLAEVEAVRSMVVTYKHELNNPLSVSTMLMEKIRKDSAPNKKDLIHLNKSLNRISEVVEKIGNLTKSDVIEKTKYIGNLEMIKLPTNS